MLVRDYSYVRKTLVALFVFLCLAACGQKPQEKLLGSWQEMSKEPGIFEFFQDGTLTMRSASKSGKNESMSGKWFILNDGRLNFDIVMLGTSTPFVVKLRFDGDDMIFITEGGTESRFKKLR